jgi:hypothetical protein
MILTMLASFSKTKFFLWVKAFFLSPWLPLVLAAVLWGISLREFNLDNMKDWGLVSVFPVSIIAAYLVLLFGFASLYVRKQVGDAVYGLYVLLLIFMIHGTPMLLFGTLRYSWAWKHVGIIDYIIRHGSVNPNIAILPVYHNWPGFFALNALITQLSGFSSSQGYAGWGPVFFETLFAFGLLSLFRLLTSDRRLQWLGVWFFLLTNWVGQDYFSPQAMTYFMMIGVLILLLLGFSRKQALYLDSWKRRISNISRFLRLPPRVAEHINNLKLQEIFGELSLTKNTRIVLGAFVLLIYGAIVSTHQLTPYNGIIAVFILVLIGVVRWRTLPIWMAVIIVFWLAFPARAYEGQVIGSTSESLGLVSQTVSSGLINVAQISAGQAIVSWMGRGLSAFVPLLAGLGAFRRVRKGHLDMLVLLLAASPIILLFLNSYGGEALFRVYFFALPYFSFLAAGAILPREKPSRGWLEPIAIGGLSVIMLVAFLFAYYGKDRQYSFTKAEAEAAQYLYSHALPNSLLVEGSRNYPSQFLNYDFFSYTPIDREPSLDRLLANPADVLIEWLSDSTRYQASYLIITRSQKIYTDDVGTMPLGSLERIQNSLVESGKFNVVFSNQDAIIFTVGEGK